VSNLTPPRKIAVVTVGRSDYGIYRPVLRKLCAEPGVSLRLIVTGAHLSTEFGMTASEIERDGFDPEFLPVEMSIGSDSPQAIAKSMGLGMIGLAQAYAGIRPDILVALGDRFEMHAAVAATVPFRIPVAHIAGGALTLGAMDDALRHSITKLSHLHFVETEVYGRRVVQMGEEPWRVTVSGAPALDNIRLLERLDWPSLNERLSLHLNAPPVLLTLHPVTLEVEKTEEYTTELLAALDAFDIPMVFTYPNADMHGRVIIRMLRDYAKRRSNVRVVENFGSSTYMSLMSHAPAMVGNSSSGIVEAASFRLPVVDIGNRQRGRLAPANVIHSDFRRDEIIEGIRRAISEEFRRSIHDLINPYGDGSAAERIVKVLAGIPLNDRLLTKEFHEP